jgi:hypothetical protein
LVLKEQQEVQEQLVLQGLPDRKEQQEMMELQGQQVLPDPKGQLDLVVN